MTMPVVTQALAQDPEATILQLIQCAPTYPVDVLRNPALPVLALAHPEEALRASTWAWSGVAGAAFRNAYISTDLPALVRLATWINDRRRLPGDRLDRILREKRGHAMGKEVREELVALLRWHQEQPGKSFEGAREALCLLVEAVEILWSFRSHAPTWPSEVLKPRRLS